MELTIEKIMPMTLSIFKRERLWCLKRAYFDYPKGIQYNYLPNYWIKWVGIIIMIKMNYYNDKKNG